ncbi:plasmid mobilization relaxosome protein MobC [Vibrio harveyi]|uniref:plasmid mobilization relaxosome protein MobC n=1 Tax=Vibrio harveyi group TaxID=717610 RepID=UPI0009718786|nr:MULTISPECIES: plasmid mobilization relaxosome protein MobC [Vibrio harveyi group]ELY1989138.1 plasmid mobilization relaxosome protein MobC [Vibrio harveyi]APX10053.1 hypothetical protein BWP24_28095 [Vibrio campbellii]ARR10545.1 hypothetical protein Vc3S01_p40059 [Vibrio campbellii]WCP78927.1 plasmid mobilization relaxosome protein MobC [Vibrio parahaemolyticus]WHP52985.1 plasmid mobilization relaxosome protein MobC [Vibrio parahaemolyticus]
MSNKIKSKSEHPKAKEDKLYVKFQLSQEQYAKYDPIIKALDVPRSEFFKHLLLNKNFTYKPSNKAQIKRTLFLIGKMSNNLNQIAHRVNADNHSGIISQRTYNLAMNELITIREILQRIADASKS